MNPERNWLNEMIDAALNDPPETVKKPDFRLIRTTSHAADPFRAGKGFPGYNPRKRRIFITAAAAVLAFSIAIPAGIITGRKISTRNIILEQNTLFVEELIGGTLFDESLAPEDQDYWILGGIMEESFFDI
jgi:hypothetical protein